MGYPGGVPLDRVPWKGANTGVAWRVSGGDPLDAVPWRGPQEGFRGKLECSCEGGPWMGSNEGGPLEWVPGGGPLGGSVCCASRVCSQGEPLECQMGSPPG